MHEIVVNATSPLGSSPAAAPTDRAPSRRRGRRLKIKRIPLLLSPPPYLLSPQPSSSTSRHPPQFVAFSEHYNTLRYDLSSRSTKGRRILHVFPGKRPHRAGRASRRTVLSQQLCHAISPVKQLCPRGVRLVLCPVRSQNGCTVCPTGGMAIG